ncbi:MAG: hypothetical protein H7A25_24410 [Leptospiraceae bacterium]|nr:hypothetical protein [Leptospiraceae bacterium]
MEYFKYRLDESYIKKREEAQQNLTVFQTHRSFFQYRPESSRFFNYLLAFFLKVSFLYSRGLKNALDYSLHENIIFVPDLPVEFREFRILHLSDLHIECIRDGGERLLTLIDGLEFDLCVITGDFRLSKNVDMELFRERMESLVGVLQCRYGISSVLGNYDSLEIVPILEKLGIRVLLNEIQRIISGKYSLQIIGVDEVTLSHSSELKNLRKKAEPNLFSILLNHSPSLWKIASEENINLYLCGQTHGGQICFPGGRPIWKNINLPNDIFSGAWKRDNMHGYTSRGIGTSVLPVRYSCPPEVVVHILHGL